MAHEDTEHNNVNLESVRGCPSENVSDDTWSDLRLILVPVCVRAYVSPSEPAELQ